MDQRKEVDKVFPSHFFVFLSFSYSPRVVIALGGRFGGEYRRMTTYVNGKVCASINKGVLQAPDGRYGEMIITNPLEV